MSESGYLYLRAKLPVELLKFMQIMVSDDAPVFDDEVEKAYRPLFKALDEQINITHLEEMAGGVHHMAFEAVDRLGKNMSSLLNKFEKLGANTMVGMVNQISGNKVFVFKDGQVIDITTVRLT